MAGHGVYLVCSLGFPKKPYVNEQIALRCYWYRYRTTMQLHGYLMTIFGANRPELSRSSQVCHALAVPQYLDGTIPSLVNSRSTRPIAFLKYCPRALSGA